MREAPYPDNIFESQLSILARVVGTLHRLSSFPCGILERTRCMPARTLWGLAATAKVARRGIRNRGQRTISAAPFAAVLWLLTCFEMGRTTFLWSLAVAGAGGLSAAF